MNWFVFLSVISLSANVFTAADTAFDDLAFLQSIKGKKVCPADADYRFMINIANKQLDLCTEIYPDITALNVTAHLTKKTKEKDSVYLNSLGRFMEPYLNTSDKLLLTTLFLRAKYKMKNSLMDQLLMAVLRKDNKNYVALYYLAKLRFEVGLPGDSKYLLGQMTRTEKKNKEVMKLYESIEGNEANYATINELLNRPAVIKD